MDKIMRKILVFGMVFLLAAMQLLVTPNASGVVTSKTYTLDADFDEGTLLGVEHDTVHDQLQLSKESGILPFFWVPNSNEGTVSKYDTVTGDELGRYHTGPTTGPNGNPSRTTVDLEGSVWLGNRATGTVIKIGLYEKGNWIDKNSDGDCDTSQDLDNDGTITGTEILPWNTDECVLFSVYVGGGPRGIAIDANNDLWVGTYVLPGGNKFFHIDGDLGTIISGDTIDLFGTGYAYRSYGALIDGNGYLWSSSLDLYVLKINPSTKAITKIVLTHNSYGLGIDSTGHVFVAGWNMDRISKIDIVTHVITFAAQGDTNSRGVAVTSDGDVWVVNSKDGDVTRLKNDLTWKATINIGAGNYGVMPTGVAVDGAGKVWVCNYYDGYLHRINPSTDAIDLSVLTIGKDGTGIGMHYSYSDMTGLIAWTVTTRTGTWTVDFDSELANAPWGKVSWNSLEPKGTSVTVQVRSRDTLTGTWSSWETASSGVGLSSTPNGRYLQIETTLKLISGDTSPILYDLTVDIANKPPVADAGQDQKSEQTSHAGAVFTLDGSGSTDDGYIQPLSYTWTWGLNSATGVSPTLTFPLGTTTVTLTVFDGQYYDSDTVDIKVVDTTPPMIKYESTQIVLWPPNHKYHTIKISDGVAAVKDICDASVDINDVVITSVSSDEPEDVTGNGDGHTLNDIVIVDAQTVKLRAERQGAGNGRVYTINFEVTDWSGNTATGSFTVWVPHDMGSGSTAIDDGASAGYTVNYP